MAEGADASQLRSILAVSRCGGERRTNHELKLEDASLTSIPSISPAIQLAVLFKAAGSQTRGPEKTAISESSDQQFVSTEPSPGRGIFTETALLRSKDFQYSLVCT